MSRSSARVQAAHAQSVRSPDLDQVPVTRARTIGAVVPQPRQEH
jgi:hypothetical protein